MKEKIKVSQKLFDLRKKIISYTKEIRKQTSNKDGNILALTWGECLIYLQFLEIIYQRYENSYKQFLDISEQQKVICSEHKDGSWKPDENELQLMDVSRNLITQLRLDIESFLVFTAVLLNKLTNFPKSYFQQSILRSVKCGSHHKFWKTIQTSDKLTNPPPREILANVKWMQENVIDFRDHLIIHTLKTDQIERQLIKGFTYHPEKGCTIMSAVLYPDVDVGEPKQYQSVELQNVIDKLKEFVPQVLKFYRSNKGVSILRLKKDK